MALYAPYEPKIQSGVEINRLRAFPSVGEPAVSQGQSVAYDTVLGHYASRQRLRTVKVEASDSKISATVLVGAGQKVKRGEVLGYYSYLFGLGYTEYTAPCDGEVVSISDKLGVITIKEAPVPLVSNLTGKVTKVDEALGIWVSSYGDVLEGAAGLGYGRSGQLVMKGASPTDVPSARDIGPEDTGKVLVMGSAPGQEVLEACLRYRVSGVVVGTLSHKVFQWYKSLVAALDWDEFLSRYWAREMKKRLEPPPPLEIVPALVVTEGLGEGGISQDAFEILKRSSGLRAFIDGAGGYAPGFSVAYPARPCVFIPKGDSPEGLVTQRLARPYLREVTPGTKVRVLGFTGPSLEGTVVEVYEDERVLLNGMKAPAVKVQVEGGETLLAPLYNLQVRE